MAGDKAIQVYNSWNTAVKLAWDCPRQTRTFLVQQVLSCGYSSTRTDILARYVSFFRSLRSSTSLEIRVLANLMGRDLLSTTGRNIRSVRVASGLDPWQASPFMVKAALSEKEQVEIPSRDKWRIEYLCSLLSQIQEAKYQTNEETKSNLQTLVNSLVL